MSRTTPNRFRVTVAETFWFEACTIREATAEAQRWSAAVSAYATVKDSTGRVLGQVYAVARPASPPLAMAHQCE